MLSACAGAPSTDPRSAEALAEIRELRSPAQDGVVEVAPLLDPEMEQLLERATRQENAGAYQDALATLREAATEAPNAPEVLQRLAEVELALDNHASALRYAQESAAAGPARGSLCRRTWLTIAEASRRAGDTERQQHAHTRIRDCSLQPAQRL